MTTHPIYAIHKSADDGIDDFRRQQLDSMDTDHLADCVSWGERNGHSNSQETRYGRALLDARRAPPQPDGNAVAPDGFCNGFDPERERLHTVAAIIDHPSVYMGGPSRQAIGKAKDILAALAAISKARGEAE